jgi:hypothetical protein
MSSSCGSGQRDTCWSPNRVGDRTDDPATEVFEDRDREPSTVNDSQAIRLTAVASARFNPSHLYFGAPERHHDACDAALEGRHGNRDVAGSRIDGKHSLTLLVRAQPLPQRGTQARSACAQARNNSRNSWWRGRTFRRGATAQVRSPSDSEDRCTRASRVDLRRGSRGSTGRDPRRRPADGSPT